MLSFKGSWLMRVLNLLYTYRLSLFIFLLEQTFQRLSMHKPSILTFPYSMQNVYGLCLIHPLHVNGCYCNSILSSLCYFRRTIIYSVFTCITFSMRLAYQAPSHLHIPLSCECWSGPVVSALALSCNCWPCRVGMHMYA